MIVNLLYKFALKFYFKRVLGGPSLLASARKIRSDQLSLEVAGRC